jgi:hypothetical protein
MMQGVNDRQEQLADRMRQFKVRRQYAHPHTTGRRWQQQRRNTNSCSSPPWLQHTLRYSSSHALPPHTLQSQQSLDVCEGSEHMQRQRLRIHEIVRRDAGGRILQGIYGVIDKNRTSRAHHVTRPLILDCDWSTVRQEEEAGEDAVPNEVGVVVPGGKKQEKV